VGSEYVFLPFLAASETLFAAISGHGRPRTGDDDVDTASYTTEPEFVLWNFGRLRVYAAPPGLGTILVTETRDFPGHPGSL
jgi:hypothetical protein